MAPWLVGSTPIERSELVSWPLILCCVLRDTFYSHSASFHLDVKMGFSKFNAWGKLAMD